MGQEAPWAWIERDIRRPDPARCAEGTCRQAPAPGSDWCEAHRCTCLVCDVVIDDGEDFCETHKQALGGRYEVELPDAVCNALHAGTHPLQQRSAS